MLLILLIVGGNFINSCDDLLILLIFIIVLSYYYFFGNAPFFWKISPHVWYQGFCFCTVCRPLRLIAFCKICFLFWNVVKNKTKEHNEWHPSIPPSTRCKRPSREQNYITKIINVSGERKQAFVAIFIVISKDDLK